MVPPPPPEDPLSSSPSELITHQRTATIARADNAFSASDFFFFLGFSTLLAVIKPNSSLIVSIVNPRS